MKFNKGTFLKIGLCLLVLLVIVACSEDVDSNQEDVANEPEESPEDAPTITWYLSDSNAPIPAKDPMDIPQINYFAEQTNTNLDLHFLAHGDYISQLRLRFAAGDFPDVYQNWGITDFDADFFINNEQGMPLNDLLEEHGPNLLEKIPDFAWDAVTIDGDIWAIPRPAQGDAPSERTIYVRGDWMDELGLDNPETSDEFLDMLREFQTLGDDVIPFGMREDLSWGTNLFGMWGLNWEDGYTEHEGELIPDAIHPNMKYALEFFNTMYEEGLLDPEFLTNTRDVHEQKINADMVGSWVHTSSRGWTWQQELNENSNQDPDVITIPTPQGVGYDGPVGRVEQPASRTYFIHKDAENPEAIVQMLDWLVSEEGKIWSELGLEGETYTIKDGEYVYDAEADRDTHWRNEIFMLHSYDEEIIKIKHGDEAEEKMSAAFEIAREEGIPNNTLGMTSPESMYDLDGLFIETASRIILGEDPIDAFDDFVETWRRNGGDEVIEHMTEQYNELN